MFGDNPIRKPVFSDGKILDIVNIFYTIQGEGVYAGKPAIFIRLSGCNLACNFCDTEFETFNPLSVGEILDKITELKNENLKSSKNFNKLLIVITGGEPFRQNLEPLCNELINHGYLVQIETNGTLWREIPKEVEIICSPKFGKYKYLPLNPEIVNRAKAFKFLISNYIEGYNKIPEPSEYIGLETYPMTIFCQPIDEQNLEKNRNNLELTKQICLQNNYNLSIQLHKIIGVE